MVIAVASLLTIGEKMQMRQQNEAVNCNTTQLVILVDSSVSTYLREHPPGEQTRLRPLSLGYHIQII